LKIIRTLAITFIFSGLTFTTVSYGDDFVLGGFDPAAQQSSSRPTQVIPGQSVIKQNANELFSQEEDPVSGNPTGSITLVEFLDYRCLHSININPVINQLISKNPQLRVVYKEFPIFGAVSMFAAKAVLAAKKQGKFAELHQVLMKQGAGLTNAKILQLAKSLGINTTQLTADMASPAITQEIESNKQVAKKLGLRATPTFFVAKTLSPTSNPIGFLLGEVTLEQLQHSVDKLKA
jgi:protein-disulfide isomerase